MSDVLGVDAWSGGWVGVELRAGRFAAAYRGSTFDDVTRQVPDATVIAVDIPLGLVDDDWRAADTAAKQFLGRRSSSVFMTPPRAALALDTHALASARCRDITGSGFSIQAWGLKTKLVEANSQFDAGRLPLWEVHPEVSFTAMGLLPSDGSKKSWRGQRARVRLLKTVGIELPEDLGAGGGVPTDDVLDAAAAAWTAHRIACGEGRPLPDPPQLNARGQSIAIWY